MPRYIDLDDDRNCYIGNDGEYERYNIDPEVIAEGTGALDEQRWVPVSERLPEDGVEVWVTIRGSDIIIPEPGETFQAAADRVMSTSRVRRGYWCEEENGWNGEFGYPLMVQPVAWMPIERPEPWGGER